MPAYGVSQKNNDIGQAYFFFSPHPHPFPSFVLAPTVRVTISTLPNLPLSENKRWRYNNITNTNKVSHTQNTPALQAKLTFDPPTETIPNEIKRRSTYSGTSITLIPRQLELTFLSLDQNFTEIYPNNSNSWLTRTVFRFPSKFALPGFFCILLACVAASPLIRLNHLYSPSAVRSIQKV